MSENAVIDYKLLADAIIRRLEGDREVFRAVTSPWMRYTEAAAYLGIKVSTLRNAKSKGEIRSGRAGLFHKDDLDRFASRGRRGNTWGKK